ALAAAAGAGLDGPELLEQLRLQLVGDAGSAVLDGDLDSVGASLDGDGDLALGRRVAERVRQQVLDGAPRQRAVEADRDGSRRLELERDAAVLAGALDRLDR